jgi:hypothetical protein
MSSPTASIAPAQIAIPSKSRRSVSKLMSGPIFLSYLNVTPQPLHETGVHLDRLARQPEGRHADQHRAAGKREAVEDSHAVSLDRELTGDGDARRPGAHHRDALVAQRDLRDDVRNPGRFVPFDQEPLRRPDREWAVDVAAPAGALTGRRADVGAHGGNRVGLAREEVALLEPALGGRVEVAAAVRANRAGFLALDVALEPRSVHRLDEELLLGSMATMRSPRSYVRLPELGGAGAARRAHRPTPGESTGRNPRDDAHERTHGTASRRGQTRSGNLAAGCGWAPSARAGGRWKHPLLCAGSPGHSETRTRCPGPGPATP